MQAMVVGEKDSGGKGQMVGEEELVHAGGGVAVADAAQGASSGSLELSFEARRRGWIVRGALAAALRMVALAAVLAMAALMAPSEVRAQACTVDLGGRRSILSATLTVGRSETPQHGAPAYVSLGYVEGVAGSLSHNSFTVREQRPWTIRQFKKDGNNHLVFNITRTRNIDPTVSVNDPYIPVPFREKLKLHICGQEFPFPNGRINEAGNWIWDGDPVPGLVDGETVGVALSIPPNNPAAGVVTITGRAAVGHTLEAGTSDITDVDHEIPNVAFNFSYRWIRVNSGTEEEIQGAGGAGRSRVLQPDDAGKRLKVRVTYRDYFGADEQLTSTESATVLADGAPPVLSDLSYVNGKTLALIFNENLKAGAIPGTDAFPVTVAGQSVAVTGVQHQNGDPESLHLTLASPALNGDTATVSYTPPSDTAKRLQDSFGNQVARIGGRVVRNDSPQNQAATGELAISGMAVVGHTLTASRGTLADGNGIDEAAFAYQWVRVEGANEADIVGADSTTYSVALEDIGARFKVRVEFTDDDGYAEARTSAATAVILDTVAPELLSAGAEVDGDTLTLRYNEALNGNSTPAVGAFTVTVAGQPATLAGVAVDGDTVTLTLSAAVARGDAVTVSYRVPTANPVKDAAGNAVGELTGVTVVNKTQKPPGTPQNLNASIRGDETLAFTWAPPQDDGGAIDGYDYRFAKGASVPLDAPWVALGAVVSRKFDHLRSGTQYAFEVRARNRAGRSPAATLSATTTGTTDFPATGAPTISGTVAVRQTLTVSTAGIDDPNGVSGATYSFQWLQVDGGAETTIYGETSNRYKVRLADIGKTLKVRVFFTDDGGSSESVTSAETAVVPDAENAPPTSRDTSIVLPEDTIYAFEANDFSFSDADGDDLHQITILRVGGIAGTIRKRPAGAISTPVTVSAADIDAGNLIFVPDVNLSAGLSFRFTVSDGIASSVEHTMTIDVQPVNDWPESSDSTVTTWEDSQHTFSVWDFNFRDVDAGDQLESVKILSLPAVGSLAVDAANGVGPPVAVTENQAITRAQLDAGALKFTPVEDAFGTAYASFTFKVNDGVSDSAHSRTMTIGVVAVNDPPTSANNRLSANEDEAFQFSLADFSYTDLEGAPLHSVRVVTLPERGALWLQRVQLTQGRQVLRAEFDRGELRFVPTTDENGAGYASFTFKVRDGGHLDGDDSVDTYTMTFDVAARNDLPRGLPVIVGEAAVGSTVTADISGITDVDGLVGVAFGYQWIRADYDGQGNLTETDIGTATTSSYAVTEDDMRSFLKVKVTFTDNGGTTASLTSAEVRVAAGNQAPTGGDGFVFIDEDGSHVFTVSDFNFYDSDFSDALSSVRIVTLPDKGGLKLFTGNLADPPQAVVAGQSVSAADINAGNFRFEPAANESAYEPYTSFTFKVSDGRAEAELANRMDITVQPVNDPATGDPVITGTGQVGETLRVDTSAIEDADGLQNVQFQYQWIRVDGGNETRISGANDSAYQPVDLDAGKNLKVEVSFHDDYGGSESRSSAQVQVAAVNHAPEGLDGTIDIDEDGSHVFVINDFSFQDSDDGDALSSVTIVTLPDKGRLTLDAENGNDPPDAVVAGQSVSAADIQAGKLRFEPAANEYDLGIYTSFTFKVSDGRAEAELANRMDVSVLPVPDPATGDPVITGTAQVGETLRVDASAIEDPDGLQNVQFRYQWIRVDGGNETDIPLANGISYQPVDLDAGKRLKVRVSFYDDQFAEETRFSAATDVVQGLPNSPPTASNGTITITEDTPDTFDIADFNFSDVDSEDSLASVTVVSLPAAGSLTLAPATAGATAVAVTVNQSLAAADIGRLTFTPAANGNGAGYASFEFKVNDGEDDSAFSYTMTVNVTAVNDPPTGAPTIVGTLRVGETLSVDTSAIEDAEGLTAPGFRYQWITVRDNGQGSPVQANIAGATGAQYRLAPGDLGARLKVRVNLVDDQGVAEDLTSGETGDVQPSLDTTAPQVVSIEFRTPSSSPTNADSLTWRVAFSEDVQNVDGADFAVGGTTATLTTAAVPGSSAAHDVTAAGGNLADRDGAVTLSFVLGQNITDVVGNALANTTPTGTNEASYLVDNTGPSVTISGVPDASAAPFTATITFLEGVSGFNLEDILVGNGTASNFTGSDGDTAFTALIRPTADGAVTVDVAADVARDAAGNGNEAAAQASSIYTAPDISAPRVASIEFQTPTQFQTNADSLTWRVTFSEDVQNLDETDFALRFTTATLTAAAVTGSAAAYDVTATGGDLADLDGAVILSFAGSQDITDAAGNVLANTAPTGTNDSIYLMDNLAPSVTITGVPDASSAPFTATISFSEGVSGFTLEDIAVGNGTASTFTGADGGRAYTALIRPSADGAVTLDVAADVARDAAGNGNLAAAQGSSTYTAPDITAPQVVSIEFRTPSSSPTNADSLTWRVAFSEDVQNVDGADFAVGGTTATLTTAAVPGSSAAHDVTAAGGNLADRDGAVTLSFVLGQNITDVVGNALANTTPTGTNEASYLVDNTGPSVTISGVPDASAAPFTATITFLEGVSGFNLEDILVGNGTASNFTGSDGDTAFTALIRPTADGAVTVDVAADVARDAAGNGNEAAAQASSIYTAPDISAPRVASIEFQTPTQMRTNADSLTWRVTFSEAVANVDSADFTVTGTTATLTATAVAGSSLAYDVKADGGNLASLDGTVTLSFVGAQNIQDAASNVLTNTNPTGANEASYVVDNMAPTVTISGVPDSNSAAFTATITFSEGVSGFVVEDIAVGNGTASTFTGADGAMAFSALVTPTGRGTVTVDVAADVAQDAAANGNLAAARASSTYIALQTDGSAPRVASIEFQTPTRMRTNADSLTWRVTFSEVVANVDAADFMVTGTTATLTATAVAGSSLAYDVKADGGNLASLDGTVTLAFATAQNIADTVGNTLTNTAPSGANDNTFELDNLAPTVTITGVPQTSTASFTATITFTEPVTGFVMADITLTNATASNFTGADGDSAFTARITPTANGAVTVDVATDVSVDAAGNGNTAAARASSTYMTVPGVPSGLTAAASGSTRINLTWSAPGSDGGSAITGYRIEVSSDGGSTWTDLVPDTGDAGITYSDTGLGGGATRHYRVSAINANGTGLPSGVANATTANNPPTFSAATAARSVAENTAAGQDVGAVLTATDADSDTLTYTLEGADAASFDIVTTSGSAQIRTKTGVTYNHEAKSTHTVIVKAGDGNGGTDTVTVTITVTDVNEAPGVPAAPSVTATAGSNTSLEVTWTAPSNTGPAVTSYDLQYRQGTSGGFTNGPQDVTGTSAAIGSLAPNRSYEVQVRASNAEGDGGWSFAGTGQTGTTVPGVPSGLTATASGSTRINLTWSAPGSDGGSAITGYRIEVSSDGGSTWTDLVPDTGDAGITYSDTGLGGGAHAPLPCLGHQRQRHRAAFGRRQRHHRQQPADVLRGNRGAQRGGEHGGGPGRRRRSDRHRRGQRHADLHPGGRRRGFVRHRHDLRFRPDPHQDGGDLQPRSQVHPYRHREGRRRQRRHRHRHGDDHRHGRERGAGRAGGAVGDRDRGIQHQPGGDLDRAVEHRSRRHLLRPAVPPGHQRGLHQRPAGRDRHQRRHREPGAEQVV